MVLLRFVYCTHFPAIYFKVAMPSESVEVTPMWVTYASAEANKTWGLLCSIPCYRSPMNMWQGCSHGIAPARLSAAGASFCFPGPGTSLFPQWRDSKAGPLCQRYTRCQPCKWEPRPHLGHTPHQTGFSPGWAAPAPLTVGFNMVPLGWATVCACAGPLMQDTLTPQPCTPTKL